MPSEAQRRRLLTPAAVLLLAAGAALAARPAVHLARRAHAAMTARTEWVRWVKVERPEAGMGEPAGWLTVESAGIDTIVLRGDTRENLQRYPCLSPRSVSFRQPGVVKVVAAHRDTHFRRLGDVRIGDRIRVLLKNGTVLIYRVCDMEVVPGEAAARRVAEKDGSDWLVLLTCHPFGFAGAAPDRFLVWARPEKANRPGMNEHDRPMRRAGGRPSTLSSPPGTAQRAGTSTVRSAPFGRAASFAINRRGGDGLAGPLSAVRYILSCPEEES